MLSLSERWGMIVRCKRTKNDICTNNVFCQVRVLRHNRTYSVLVSFCQCARMMLRRREDRLIAGLKFYFGMLKVQSVELPGSAGEL